MVLTTQIHRKGLREAQESQDHSLRTPGKKLTPNE